MKSVITVLIIILLCSCHKKYDCTYHYQDRDLAIAFSNLDTTIVDTIIAKSYLPNDSFNTLKFIDTVTKFTIAWKNNDTVILARLGYGTNYDLELTLMQTPRIYRISKGGYNGPSEFHIERESSCGGGGNFYRDMDSAKVNGQYTYTTRFFASYGSVSMLILR